MKYNLFFKYIRFLYQSKNEHSVHSPFVFDLVTKCFYNRKKRAIYTAFKSYITADFSQKDLEFLYRLLDYFHFETYWLFQPDLQNFVKAFFSWEVSESKPDFLFVQDTQNIWINSLSNLMHNDSVLLIYKPYESSEKEKIWQKIVENPPFTLTIDTFDFGLAFIRKEQRKQHFIIRL